MSNDALARLKADCEIVLRKHRRIEYEDNECVFEDIETLIKQLATITQERDEYKMALELCHKEWHQEGLVTSTGGRILLRALQELRGG